MATDGVKIIDGDLAHDTYSQFMDLYDSGADFDIINANFPIVPTEDYDDFDLEIYVTACTLALWEIGLMTDDKLQYVKSVIDKGACVKNWTNINEKHGKTRQKELDKFWKKISQKNTKVRKRKKYIKITNLHFQPNDLLTFQLKDGNYCAVVCAEIDQQRGQCNYILIPTTYKSTQKPTVNDLLHSEILGIHYGCGSNYRQTTKAQQPGIERIWDYLEDTNCNFFFGLVQHAVNHKDFYKFKEKFEKIGSLQIIDGLKNTGSFSYEDSFECFENIFGDLENEIEAFHYKKYPVKVLCDILEND